MSLLLYKLGHLCMRHRRIVVGRAGLVVVIAVALVAKSAGEQTSNNLTLPGTGSTKATDLLDSTCPTRPTGPTRSC